MNTHLSPATLQAWRSAGLHVRDTPNFPPGHVAWPDGYTVLKPVAAGGNRLRSLSFFPRAGLPDGETDAPAVHVWRLRGGWGIEVAEYAPGPGPGDFRVMVRDEAALVAAVLTYFFQPNREFEARRRAE